MPVYFYDCIDDLRKPSESDAAYKARLDRQAHGFQAIGLLDGFFLRLGSVRGSPNNKRQEEVDVLLAVDMLTHAHRRSTERMTLVSGDLDFKPVVEAVVELGVRIAVACEAKGGSVDLALAADRRQLLSLASLWQMSTGCRHERSEALFSEGHGHKWFDSGPRIKVAQTVHGPVYICKAFDLWSLDLSEQTLHRDLVHWATKDEPLLRAFAKAKLGNLIWSDA